MLAFLYDKNRIRQLTLKARQFYGRMLNIQTKWKNVLLIQEQRRVQMGLEITQHKLKLRDSICLCKPLFKKYHWLINEIVSYEFDPEDKDGFVN